MKTKSKWVAITLVATIAGSGHAFAANPPRDLQDLKGARGPTADSLLGQRGYKVARVAGDTEFWWNSNTKTCANVYIDDGRVEEVDTATSKDCGKGGTDKGNEAAAALMGALLVGAVVAGAQDHGKNHHHDDDDYGRNYHGRGSYSPASDVTCYPREAACYKDGDFSAKWTRREF